MCRLYGKFASYLRRILCKTRLIFPRINGPNVSLNSLNFRVTVMFATITVRVTLNSRFFCVSRKFHVIKYTEVSLHLKFPSWRHLTGQDWLDLRSGVLFFIYLFFFILWHGQIRKNPSTPLKRMHE